MLSFLREAPIKTGKKDAKFLKSGTARKEGLNITKQVKWQNTQKVNVLI